MFGVSDRASVEFLRHKDRVFGVPAAQDGERVEAKRPVMTLLTQDGRLTAGKELAAVDERIRICALAVE